MPRALLLALLAVTFAAPDASAQALAAGSLYADVKARQAGDIVTVVLAERTNARRQSQYADRAQANVAGSAGVTSSGLSGRFGADAQFQSDASAENQTVQSDLLTGTVTALVTEVLPGGLLRIEGERRLNVNGVTHLMRVGGIIRPADVRADNSVLSFHVANAEVVYRQDGLTKRFFSPGTLAKVGAAALLVLAVVLGS